MKNIVVLVRNYIPYNSAVGICMKNIADCIKEQACITVICEKVMLDEKEEEHIDGHNIVRFITKQSMLRKKMERGENSSNVCKRLLCKFGYQAVRIWYNILFFISRVSVQSSLVDYYIKALDQIEGKIDLILPTCMPIESIIAADKFCSRNKNSTYIPILFDKFATNGTLHRTNFNKKIKMRANLQLEKDIFGSNKCKRILYVPSWSEHINHYPQQILEKCKPIEHPLIKKFDMKEDLNYDIQKINIVYTGALTVEGRDPSQALALFSDLLQIHHDIFLHFYGAGNAVTVIEDFEKKFALNIKHYGRVSSDRAHSAMVSADLLLSLGNSDITQIPSKIFEYMSCCKPIIHIALKYNDPAFKILNNYPASCCVCLETSTDQEALNTIIAFIDSVKGKTISFKTLERRYANAMPEYSAKLILDTNDLAGEEER